MAVDDGGERGGQVRERIVLPPLQHSIDSTKTGDLTFLVTEYGKAFSPAGSATGSAIAAPKQGCQAPLTASVRLQQHAQLKPALPPPN